MHATGNLTSKALEALLNLKTDAKDPKDVSQSPYLHIDEMNGMDRAEHVKDLTESTLLVDIIFKMYLAVSLVYFHCRAIGRLTSFRSTTTLLPF